MKQLEKYLPIIIILPLFLYIYISFYCQPIADDFTFSAMLRNQSIFEGLDYLYSNRMGRYFSNFLVLVNPMAFHLLWVYKIFPSFILIITGFAIFYFIKELTNSVFSFKEYLVTSSVILLLYLVYMPDMAEGIYWYTGNVTYHTSLVFLMLYSISIIKLFKQTPNWYFWQVVSIILLFITIGFNEVMMAFLDLFLIIIAVLYLKKVKKPIWLLIHLVLALVFSSIMFFAPGNEGRGSSYPNNHKLIESLIMSAFQTFRFFTDWISASLVILSLFFIPINNQLSKSVSLFKNSFYLKPAVSLLLLVSIIIIAAFLPYWSTGILRQHRTLNLAYFIFILLWFINLNVWYNWLNIETKKLRNPKTVNAGLILLFLLLLFTRNSYNILEDTFYNRHKKYDRQMSDRFRIINTCETDTIIISKLNEIPKSLFVLDISPNSTDWTNVGYLIYLDKEDKTLIGTE